jgi:hypothetical protein
METLSRYSRRWYSIARYGRLKDIGERDIYVAYISGKGKVLKVEGSYTFASTREKVWDSLFDPDVLFSCIPGAEKFEATGEDAYEVALKVKVAAITGNYSGKIRLVEKNHPDSYKMMVEGQGSGGTVKGEVVMNFSASGSGTDVRVAGDAQVTGTVARVGQRLMGSAAKMLMNQFFGCLKNKIG